MVYYLDLFPEIIINKINDYLPRDRDMKAPTALHIKSLLYYYNYDYDELFEIIDNWEDYHSMHSLNPRDEYLTELLYRPHDNEPFYKYTLRMRIKEIKAKGTIYEDFYIRHI